MIILELRAVKYCGGNEERRNANGKPEAPTRQGEQAELLLFSLHVNLASNIFPRLNRFFRPLYRPAVIADFDSGLFRS